MCNGSWNWIWIIYSLIKYIYFINKYFLNFYYVSDRKWIREKVLQTEEFARGNSLKYLYHHPRHVDYSLVLGSGTTGVASALWEPMDSWQPSTWLPGNCCCKSSGAMSYPVVFVGPLGNVCHTHVLRGDWILRHCSTESYILSSTHPWRLVKSLWLWMHKIPFLLHVECAVKIKWNFLICWLLPGAERKWVEDADEVTFLCLVYKDSQAHPGWILCSLHPWYPNCGPRTSRVGITQEPVKNTKSQAAPRPTLW